MGKNRHMGSCIEITSHCRGLYIARPRSAWKGHSSPRPPAEPLVRHSTIY
jgi:hypothetical protein